MVSLQPKLNLKVSQRQILTPGLMQMVSVLALNKLELKDMIQAEIAENPVLEELEESVPMIDHVAEPDQQPVATDPAKPDPFDEIDFGSYFQEYLDPGFRSPHSAEISEKPSLESYLSKPGSLQDHLLWQLGALSLSAALRDATEYIVGNLNEDGYLIASQEELFEGYKAQIALHLADYADQQSQTVLANAVHKAGETLVTALAIVRGLDPVGVASRDLRECLLAQIAAEREEAQHKRRRGDSLRREPFDRRAEAEEPRSPHRGNPRQLNPEGAEAGESSLAAGGHSAGGVVKAINGSAREAAGAEDHSHEDVDWQAPEDDPEDKYVPTLHGSAAPAEMTEAQGSSGANSRNSASGTNGATGSNGANPHATAHVDAVPMHPQSAIFNIAERIVDKHLQLLQKRDLRELAKAVNTTVEQANLAFEFIRTLDPRPGQRFNRVDVRLIEPDVTFVKRDDEYVAVMDDESVPSLRLNQGYRRLLKQATAEKDVKDYVKERYRSALQLMRNIEQRKNTILRTCEVIVRRQQDFLEHGVEALKPMMIKEVAEEIGVHPSTVSRAVSNKYVHTPQGVFELRFFFTEGVSGPEGSGTPLLLLKRRVKKLIDEEDPRKPLTDELITHMLQSQGIDVTRRTVAKYREDLRIPSTHQRRVRD
jgi:DNA-directed RNA polymerase specialized sigma54-like protein